MSSLEAPDRLYLPEEYFELEFQSEEKHEYLNGRIYAMAGANPEHVDVQSNVQKHLSTALDGRPCRVHVSDMKILVNSSGLYTYADVSVTCGVRQFGGVKNESLLNPTLIVEVLSPSTEAYDRRTKWTLYRQIESLAEYVLIAQDRMSVEVRTKQPNGTWIIDEFSNPEAYVALKSVDCSVLVRDIYRDVTPQQPGLRIEYGESG